jgi:hypothetical protein
LIDCSIDKTSIIHIFKPVFISSFINLILIENGVGNRPVDAVATGSEFSGCRVLNPAFHVSGWKDEMKISLYLFISSEEVFHFKVYPELVSGTYSYLNFTK